MVKEERKNQIQQKNKQKLIGINSKILFYSPEFIDETFSDQK